MVKNLRHAVGRLALVGLVGLVGLVFLCMAWTLQFTLQQEDAIRRKAHEACLEVPGRDYVGCYARERRTEWQR